MIWFGLAIGVLLLVWIVWPTKQRDLPVLLLVRDRAEEIEGVLRQVTAAGCVVHVLVRESRDDSLRLVREFALESDGVLPLEGDLDQALEDAGMSAAVLVRLDDGRPVRAVLQEAGF